MKPLPSAVPPDLTEAVAAFEQLWRTGTVPRIESFVSPGAANRSSLLRALIGVDLDHRWRKGRPGAAVPAPERWRLENYLERFGDPAGQPALLIDLLGEEYRARQRWGDRPGHDEYLARFPSHAAALGAQLARADAELAAEFAGEGGRPGDAQPLAHPVKALPMDVASVPALLETLRQKALLTVPQLNEVFGGAADRSADARVLARELLQRGWLTPFQLNQLLQGRGADLVVGPYLLLERLGEGGCGQVFKARQRHLNRIVALKLVRKEHVQDAELVARFRREIQAISRLDHPNVVRACDAAPGGNSFYLAMDYVEGIDLSRLVKRDGPLHLERAVDYTRQAALGLQYIHEQGLVHRDIKPSNLLLSVVRGPWSVVKDGQQPVADNGPRTTDHGQIKILDLGLARLTAPAAGELTATLTENHGVVMGTLDYMAPEQALDFHGADIRADIYSLGCTLFFLLTGQPPFAAGTIAQKLAAHMNAEPPLERIRRDFPPGAEDVLCRMLAKAPADRIQTPGEVAEFLATLPAASSRAYLPVPVARALVRWPLRRPLGRLLAPLRPDGSGRWRRRAIIAGLVGAILLVAGWLLWPRKPLDPANVPEKAKVYLSDFADWQIRPHAGTIFAKGGRFTADGKQHVIVADALPRPKSLYLKPAAPAEPGIVTFQLARRYELFKATVGNNPSPGSFSGSRFRFVVSGDGTVLWTSRWIGGSADKLNEQQECVVPVKGVEWLELMVNISDTAQPVWLDPFVAR